MSDRFDIQRKWDNEAAVIERGARASLDDQREAERARRKRLIRLSSGYYFDPLEKALLKKEGSQFGFVRHDRRFERTQKASQAEAEARGFRMVLGGLFWDLKGKKLYRKSGKNYVLYSGDRRNKSGKNPAGEERRRAR
jgi:hypothetical protein